MPIYFRNEEPIDLDVIRFMGVSVKPTENPIGFFGTGLKYAIATALRTGHGVELWVRGKAYVFTTEKREIRGEEFEVVRMGGEDLPFTTALGRTWEPWQAFREFYSNTVDEGGEILDEWETEGQDDQEPRPIEDYGTVFRVVGEGIAQAYLDRRKIFVHSTPSVEASSANIHDDGGGTSGFYRGVRVHEHRKPSLFSYDVQAEIKLTEDRTAEDQWSYEWEVRRAIEDCDDEEIVERVLLADKETHFEGGLAFGGALRGKPSEAFVNVVMRHAGNGNLNASARRWVERTAQEAVTYVEVEPSDAERRVIDQARMILDTLECGGVEFRLVEDLGLNCFGLCRGGEIFIDRKTLDKGERFVASTLYEEHLHTLGYEDESRSLQNLLFERLIAFAVAGR